MDGLASHRRHFEGAVVLKEDKCDELCFSVRSSEHSASIWDGRSESTRCIRKPAPLFYDGGNAIGRKTVLPQLPTSSDVGLTEPARRFKIDGRSRVGLGRRAPLRASP